MCLLLVNPLAKTGIAKASLENKSERRRHERRPSGGRKEGKEGREGMADADSINRKRPLTALERCERSEGQCPAAESYTFLSPVRILDLVLTSRGSRESRLRKEAKVIKSIANLTNLSAQVKSILILMFPSTMDTASDETQLP